MMCPQKRVNSKVAARTSTTAVVAWTRKALKSVSPTDPKSFRIESGRTPGSVLDMLRSCLPLLQSADRVVNRDVRTKARVCAMLALTLPDSMDITRWDPRLWKRRVTRAYSFQLYLIVGSDLFSIDDEEYKRPIRLPRCDGQWVGLYRCWRDAYGVAKGWEFSRVVWIMPQSFSSHMQ
jgi:hypothetical protein